MRRFLLLIFSIMFLAIPVLAHMGTGHEMQHGFIISSDNQYYGHLVASGHHSHQLSFTGELMIEDSAEKEIYEKQKVLSQNRTYFLFQAQKLNLPTTSPGQVLTGHIVESNVGDYTPKNIIVKNAKIRVDKIHINVINPFFVE